MDEINVITNEAPPETAVSLEKEADEAFSKSLAAAIMAQFPIASIIAIIFAVKGRNLVNALFNKAEALGVSAGGKGIAAKILSIAGLISSIVNTALYALLGVIFFIYIIAIAFMVSYY